MWKPETEIALRSFVDEVRLELMKFEDCWRREHKTSPTEFPLVMPVGEWWDAMFEWEHSH